MSQIFNFAIEIILHFAGIQFCNFRCLAFF